MTPQVQKEQQMKLTDSVSKVASRADSRWVSLVAILLFGCFVGFVPPAAAAPTVVDQYTEHVPTPGGEQVSGSITRPGQPGNHPGAPAGSPSRNESPQALGNLGASSPISSSRRPTSSKPDGAPRSDQEGQANSEQAGAAASQSAAIDQGATEPTLVAAVDRPGGMGIAFPLVLIGCLLVAVFVFAHKRGFVQFPKEKDAR